MTRSFRVPRFPVFGVVVLMLAAGPAEAVSLEEANLFNLASDDKDHRTVRQLLAKGVSPNVPVGRFNDGQTAVHAAAEGGAIKNLMALLDAGGDLHARDRDGNTPLHLASRGVFSGYADVVRVLLERGADLHRPNARGETPLHVAVYTGIGGGSADRAVIKALLDAGARPKTVDGTGLTAIQRFARHGGDMGWLATLLLGAGADPDQKDPRGDAPLHAAIKEGGSNGKAAVVKALLQGGADPCVQDARGYTPYQMSSGMQRIHRALDRANGGDLACDDSKMVYEESDGSEDDSGMAYEEGEGSDDSSEMTYEAELRALEEKAEEARRAEAARIEKARRQEAARRAEAEVRRRAEAAELRALKERMEAEQRAEAERLEARLKEARRQEAARRASLPPAVANLDQQMVTVSGNTQLSKYEVTQELWEAVMGTNPSHFGGCGQCPVEQVSWDDIQVFLRKLNAMTGEAYRLPTEAEWAGALGSGGGAWHWENSGKRTHPVGQKSPNGLGLYDMKGNVWEWMEDCWEGNCHWRVWVWRGGAWHSNPEDLRAADRVRSDAIGGRGSVGFRLARTLTP